MTTDQQVDSLVQVIDQETDGSLASVARFENALKQLSRMAKESGSLATQNANLRKLIKQAVALYGFEEWSHEGMTEDEIKLVKEITAAAEHEDWGKPLKPFVGKLPDGDS